MAVQNLQSGAILNLTAGQIRGNAHVYRTNQGYAGPGSVAFQPTGGPVQVADIAVGQTATFAVNGQAGMIASAAPSMLQVLYDNGTARLAGKVAPDAVRGLIEKGRSQAAVTKGSRFGRRALAADPSPAQQAVQTLTAQWYNAVIAGLSLDASTFQLVQGNQLLGATSTTM